MKYLLPLIVCLFTAHAHAGVATVSTTADSGPGSLRAAVALGAPVEFAPSLSGGTIILTTGEITITNSITIDASMLPRGITISGNRNSRVFLIESGTTVTLDSLTIVDGRAPGGAGVRSVGNLTMRNCTISRNQAVSETAGGGVRHDDGNATLEGCTFSHNYAALGGGLYSATAFGVTTTRVVQCTFTGNEASDAGGGVHNDIGSMVIESSTLTGNRAPNGSGAGLASYGDGVARTDVTLCVIAGNHGTDVDFVFNPSNTVNSIEGNLIGDGNATNAFTSLEDLVGIEEPLLARLGCYGGPTQTMPPLESSLAINAGVLASSSQPFDQRGFPRSNDGVLDFGAVELGPVITVTNAADAGPGTLRQALIDGTNAGQVVRFDNIGPIISLTGELSVSGDRAVFVDASANPGLVLHAPGFTRHVTLADPDTTLALHGITLENGNASGDGGAIFVAGTLTLADCEIRDCRADDQAGAVSIQSGARACLVDSRFTRNQADDGGAIYNEQGHLEVTRCVFTHNAALGSAGTGGAISEAFGYTTLLSSTFEHNRAKLGGAISTAGITFDLLRSTLAHNHADNAGGLYNAAQFGTARAQNSTFCGNRAYSTGGGIYNQGDLIVDACTITENRAPAGQGAGLATWAQFGISTEVARSIIAGNHGTDVDPVAGSVMGVVVSAGANLIGDGDAAGVFFLPRDVTGVADPHLTALGYYGGATKTKHPLAGSPAINGGTTADLGNHDQRGFTRRVNFFRDIGAVEVGPTLLVTSILDSGPGSLRDAVTNATVRGQVIGFDTNALPDFLVISLSTQIVVATGQHLFIDGSALSPIISGNGSDRMFEVQRDASLALHRGFLTAGRTTTEGGAVYNRGDLTLESAAVSINRARSGGGIYADDASRTGLYDVYFFNNVATNSGGGLFINRGEADLVGCTMDQNEIETGGFGGGIENDSGTLSLMQCTLTGNVATNGGRGGGLEHYSGTAHLTGCTFDNNQAANGGGLSNDSADLFLVNTTISGNTAINQGAGINVDSGRVELDHSTVTENLAPANRGSGLFGGSNTDSVIRISRSIVGENQDTDLDFTNSLAVFISGNHNIVGNGSAAPAFSQPNDFSGATTLNLLPLGDYGGPTRTHLPFITSPAAEYIAAADSPSTVDQRGFPRPADASFAGTYRIDAGAVETDPEFIWASDLDGDGSPFGIEVATGTDVEIFEPNNDGLIFLGLDDLATGMFFSFETNAAPFTAWVISRATSLHPQNWTEIYRFDGPTGTEIAAPGENYHIDFTAISELGFAIGIDSNSPPGNVFYRLEADFIPPPPLP